MDTAQLPDLHRLVEQIRLVTDAPLPEMLEPDAPVLGEGSLAGSAGTFYLVGIIGGKNVGKSALVNALVGEEITERTSCGPGTDRVVAYAHASQLAGLRGLLDREVPGQYEIVEHEHAQLVRQVLLDLPDFDSHYTAHLEITRRMLRHMLYPVWLQSIEKYADGQPRDLLRRVTAGNDPHNFVFCLNKVDQLEAAGQWGAAEEIRRDSAERIRQTLGLREPSRVWLISALHPDRYDLPGLREMLAQQRSEELIAESRQLAARRQMHSLADWIDAQRLPERLERVRRLEEQAQEELVSRVAGPLIETALPQIVSDVAWSTAVTDEVMRRRVARWPVLNMLHVFLEPILAGLRGRLIPTSLTRATGAAEVVASHVARLPQPLSLALQATFARLQQFSPLMSRLYADPTTTSGGAAASGRLWERMPADAQADQLQQRIAGVLDARAAFVHDRLSGGDNPFSLLARWLLTIGAALWFVVGQRVLELYLTDHKLTQLALTLVQISSAVYLLRSLAFLAGYYLILWLMLRWRTQRRVERSLVRGSRREPALPAQLTEVVFDWVQDLLAPLRRSREQLEGLIESARNLNPPRERVAA